MTALYTHCMVRDDCSHFYGVIFLRIGHFPAIVQDRSSLDIYFRIQVTGASFTRLLRQERSNFCIEHLPFHRSRVCHVSIELRLDTLFNYLLPLSHKLLYLSTKCVLFQDKRSSVQSKPSIGEFCYQEDGFSCCINLLS